jgi:UDP-N-acetylglucosamine 4,6-dehydratase
MKITDLARLVGPDCKLKETGIRPGEKLHEVLLTEDEARHSFEFKTKFIVEPEAPWWVGREQWKGGKKLADDFRYTSDNNTQWLTDDELQAMIDETAQQLQLSTAQKV